MSCMRINEKQELSIFMVLLRVQMTKERTMKVSNYIMFIFIGIWSPKYKIIKKRKNTFWSINLITLDKLRWGPKTNNSTAEGVNAMQFTVFKNKFFISSLSHISSFCKHHRVKRNEAYKFGKRNKLNPILDDFFITWCKLCNNCLLP